MLFTWPLVCFTIPCKLIRLKAASASTREFKLQGFQGFNAQRSSDSVTLVLINDWKLRPQASGVVFFYQVHMAPLQGSKISVHLPSSSLIGPRGSLWLVTVWWHGLTTTKYDDGAKQQCQTRLTPHYQPSSKRWPQQMVQHQKFRST